MVLVFNLQRTLGLSWSLSNFDLFDASLKVASSKIVAWGKELLLEGFHPVVTESVQCSYLCHP